MTKTPTCPVVPIARVQVFPAEAIWVIAGANLGDPIGTADDCVPGDVYQLDPDETALLLQLDQAEPGSAPCHIVSGSQIGAPGDSATLASRLTLMAADGERVEVLVICHDTSGALFALPLSPLAPGADYTLIDAGAGPGDIRLGDVVCVSLARGTGITLPGGARRPVERLKPGDLILTRDHGPQPLRWIGKATLRAQGAFAPVVIAAGAIGNIGDLVVGQHHRIFVYQRGKARVGGSAELLVQAKHLVDGDMVRLREGGFLDYYSLVFDRHEIIYAEGIPCESLIVNDAVLSRLPGDLAEEVWARLPGLSHAHHFATEAGPEAVDALALLRRGREPDSGLI